MSRLAVIWTEVTIHAMNGATPDLALHITKYDTLDWSTIHAGKAIFQPSTEYNKQISIQSKPT